MPSPRSSILVSVLLVGALFGGGLQCAEPSGSAKPSASADTAGTPDVPYVPTPQWAVERMLRMADVTAQDTVYDLGCGDGRFLITAAQ